MNSNDAIVSMVTNALQKGEKIAKLKTRKKNGIKWYKQSITFFLCIYGVLANFR